MSSERVLSGMRPTGAMHIGHYHGALKNWVRLQDEYRCFFFVADWHALTTAYDEVSIIEKSAWDMLVDWLAAGLDPERSTIFIQSRVLEHAELTLLLGMTTPLGWLERMPTYKDQIEKLSHKDLTTYGFLGYPLMQSADILIYRASYVPVGEDQVPHIEITREVARRFNHLFGREPGFADKVRAAVAKLGKADGKTFELLKKRYGEQGDADSLVEGRQLLANAKSLGAADRERLLGHLTGSRRQILVEPGALVTESPRLPGLDGAKMSTRSRCARNRRRSRRRSAA
jgi:tryptophanyl-tRNA synthetase